ncbi:cGMP-dependent 3',5'-cyclic phosphodiesterase-like [Chelonus insularis]|uniref:cGMP-dependent 3',5'-cyclic phosphodiesterase-like n=1 Tax=Chelonus insularis TaxID=460826 RepID=UPI00158D144D|nr:cGMP-dependent 3',5'-cyclic phosphodiesterase-like [Chelonus insularis]XP_034938912.1 cGMP-dependent 3',5'-cyclic phosphodiesterase-like [Chelonus insularis]
MSSLQLELTAPETLLSLIQSLADLPCSAIQQKLNKYIQEKTGAELSFLAPILPKTEEIVVHVVGQKILDRGLRFPINQSEEYNEVLNRVIRLRKAIEIDCNQLNQELLGHLKSSINSTSNKVLSIPIEHPIDQHIALVVCINNYPNEANAETVCTKIVQECFRYCLGLVLTTLNCEEETRLKLQCQNLLTVSRKLFTHLGDLTDLLREIMIEARKLTNAERCSLFLLDNDHQELVAKVFDGIKAADEMRVPINQGIAGHVATSGNLLNIRNAYEHPLFYRGMDEVTGFRTRNILCFPIRDETQIIGVAQLCNKINGLYFDVCDEEVATAFSIYCGISIMHSIIYKKIQDAQARSKISNELMMYHMKVEEDAIIALLNCKDDHSLKDFDKFDFCPRSILHEHTPCYTLRMFDDLGLTKFWRIQRKALAQFILYVKKGYRDAPYHNWIHAFSVAHFAYLMIKNFNLVANNYMSQLQSLVFLVSCLCHDIDHRGTNNSFQTQCGTVLASLYSSEGSVMERHHLAQSMCILNTDGCNIFENLEGDLYSKALDLLRNNILATDLASHFRTMDEQEKMLREGYEKENPTHQKLLHAMFMTCCDLSDQTKDWRTSKKTAEQIYDEFFSQGDLEKSMGTAPIEMMDRERASIPNLQVQFITNLVLPLFQNLATLFPIAECLVKTIKKNRDIWKSAVSIFHEYSKNGIKGMDVLLDPNVEQQILTAYESQTKST